MSLQLVSVRRFSRISTVKSRGIADCRSQGLGLAESSDPPIRSWNPPKRSLIVASYCLCSHLSHLSSICSLSSSRCFHRDKNPLFPAGLRCPTLHFGQRSPIGKQPPKRKCAIRPYKVDGWSVLCLPEKYPRPDFDTLNEKTKARFEILCIISFASLLLCL